MATTALAQNPILRDTPLGSKFVDPDYLFDQGTTLLRQFPESFGYIKDLSVTIVPIYHIALFFLALFFLILISYSTIRIFQIRKKEREHLKHEIAEYAHHQTEREKKMRAREEISKNPRWVKTLEYLFSQHESDWKLAVIEADTLLEDLMNQMGFRGESLGDKLKSAGQQSNFRGLSAAWEVHSVRNRIAHEGVNFKLSQHEAKRVIALYEQIFREFDFI